MDEERLASLRELEARLGYRFREIQWLDRALTHKSFTHESSAAQPTPSRENGNEVLEFLGDAVLSLAISHLLLQAFPDAQEGVLSKKRSHLVKRSFLAHLSKELELEQDLLLGKGELLDGGRRKIILANVYEALIGLHPSDSGFDQSREIIEHHFRAYLGSETALSLFTDYKSLLQESVQQSHRFSPKYQVVEESGPDHDKRFQATVLVGKEMKGERLGKEQKEAEQEAAKNALEELQTAKSSAQIDKPETGQTSEELQTADGRLPKAESEPQKAIDETDSQQLPSTSHLSSGDDQDPNSDNQS